MYDSIIVTVTLNPSLDRVIEAPRFRVGEHVRGKVVESYPAGKGIIVSRVLATLGTRSIATGFVGQEELADFERFLERVGQGRIVTQFLVVRGRTRENITIVDPIDDTETHLRDVGFEVQSEDVRRVASKVGLLAHRGSVLVFAGSTPPGVPNEAYVEMVRSCRARGARVVVDSSGGALEAFRDERLWMVKLNARELAALTGQDTSTEDKLRAAARSLTAGEGGKVDYVVITAGADGALIVGPEIAMRGRVSVHPGRIVSTVGCGDSLLAGLLHGWRRTGEWEAAFREGLAAATANALGREAGRLTLEEVDEFRSMCILEAV